MFNDHLVERLVITVGDQGFRGLFIKGAGFLDEAHKGAAVFQMREGVFDFGGTEGMDIEANVFAVAALFVALKDADLVESAAQIRAAKRFVLVEFQTVLIVQMKRP